MDNKDLQLEKARIYAVLSKQLIDVLVNDLATVNVSAAEAAEKAKAAAEPPPPAPSE